ncbi:hypothetical protein B484DRAFT_276484, partial [Ochromonadaceae sp. CCMP2298]
HTHLHTSHPYHTTHTPLIQAALHLPTEQGSASTAAAANRLGSHRSPHIQTIFDPLYRALTPGMPGVRNRGGGDSGGVGEGVGGDIDGTLPFADLFAESGAGPGTGGYGSGVGMGTGGGIGVGAVGSGGALVALGVLPMGQATARKHTIDSLSVAEFRTKGFVHQRPLPHATHWRLRLSSFLAQFPDANGLRKLVGEYLHICTLPSVCLCPYLYLLLLFEMGTSRYTLVPIYVPMYLCPYVY